MEHIDSISIPDETMAVAASLALARTSSELAGPGVPNVVVTHPGGFSSSAHSETKAQCEGCSRLNFSENIGFNLRRRTQESFLLMVHDASRGGQHHCSKLSGGQQVVGPLLNILQGNVESAVGVKSRSIFLFSSVCAPGRDDAALVKPAGEVDHNLAGAMVINHLSRQKV